MAEVKVSLADITRLREFMGAGMMDCKKALEEAGGDFDAAVDVLRKKGIAKAAKREDREAKEGVVIATTLPNQTRGVIIALNCETDFVARNEGFIAIATTIAKAAVDHFPENLDALLGLEFGPGLSIRDKVGEINGTIGEKIELSRFEKITGAQVLPYNHSNGKLAVLLAINKRENAFEEAARSVAMQVAAMGPVSVSKDDVPADIVAKEMEIGRELARNEGKPEAMLEKIAEGRLNKFFAENTLLSQKFVKDNSLSVDQYLKSLDKDLTVTAFCRIGL